MLRMAPGRPAAIRRAANSCEQTNVPFSTMSTTDRHPFGLSSAAATGKLPAALFTRTPTAPSSCSTASNAAATDSGCRTSIARPTARPPTASTAATPRARWPSSRLATATAAPSRANSTAIALPRPVPPPVTSTTSSSNVPGGSIAVPSGGGSGRAMDELVAPRGSTGNGLLSVPGLTYTREHGRQHHRRRPARHRRSHRDRHAQPARPPERMELGDGDGAHRAHGGHRGKPRRAGGRAARRGAVVLRRHRLEARRSRPHRRTVARGEGPQLLPPLPRLAPSHAGDRGDPAADRRGAPRPLSRRRLRDRDARRYPARRRGHRVRLPGGEDRRRDRLRARPSPGAGGRAVVGEVDDVDGAALPRGARASSRAGAGGASGGRAFPEGARARRRDRSERAARRPGDQAHDRHVCRPGARRRAALRSDERGRRVRVRRSRRRICRRPREADGTVRGEVTMKYRVIQWATGGVGRAAIQGIVEHPELELVGCWVHGRAKDGRDAGELAGITPLGVKATRDVDALLALDADCVLYSPILGDAELVARILRSGKNVVTPLGWFYPWRSPDVAALEAACHAGRTTLHGTGIHPGGITERFPLMVSALSGRVTHVRAEEFSDIRTYSAPDVIRDIMLFGKTPEEAAQSPMVQFLASGFFQSIDMVAAELRVELDPEKTTRHEIAVATTPIDSPIGPIPPGRVAAPRFTWEGP